MNATPPHAVKCAEVKVFRSQWLRKRVVPGLHAALLIAAAGCVNSGELGEDTTEAIVEDTTHPSPTAAPDPTLAALSHGAYATPESVGGFCVQGVGVFLSAVDDIAELTLYVVAPAERVTFEPAMYLTTQEGDHATTEVAELDALTLEAGESRVFRREAQGPLMGVFADFADE